MFLLIKLEKYCFSSYDIGEMRVQFLSVFSFMDSGFWFTTSVELPHGAFLPEIILAFTGARAS